MFQCTSFSRITVFTCMCGTLFDNCLSPSIALHALRVVTLSPMVCAGAQWVGAVWLCCLCLKSFPFFISLLPYLMMWPCSLLCAPVPTEGIIAFLSHVLATFKCARCVSENLPRSSIPLSISNINYVIFWKADSTILKLFRRFSNPERSAYLESMWHIIMALIIEPSQRTGLWPHYGDITQFFGGYYRKLPVCPCYYFAILEISNTRVSYLALVRQSYLGHIVSLYLQAFVAKLQPVAAFLYAGLGCWVGMKITGAAAPACLAYRLSVVLLLDGV